MRKIAIVLTFLLLMQAIPIGSLAFASSLSPVDLVNMDEAEIEALSDTDIYNAITSSDNYPPTVEAKLKNGGSTDNVTVSLNINSYRKYRLIVYGVPFEKESKYPGKTLPGSEPKFLGFNEKGIPVTNDKSPSLPGDKEPYEKKWNHYTNQYEKTWTDVSNTDASGQDISALYKHLLLSGTINDDASDNYTLAYILYGVMGDLKKYLGGDEDTLREKLESVVQLQMLPTFVSKGSFKMTHNTVTDDNPSGSKRYDTMEWERLGDINEHLTVVPEKKKIVMFPDQDEVTNKFTVTVHYDDKVSGMDTSGLIKSFVKIGMDNMSENVPSTNPTFTFTKTYKRDEYKFGIYDIEENGGFYFESIFGDKYDGNEKCSFELEVKMQGDLAVDFISKHDSKICDDYLNPIVLNEGSWDSPDDIVKIDLEDKSLISQALVNEIPDAKIISWNWFVKNKDGSFEQFNSTLTPNISYDLTFGSDYTFNTFKEDGKVETVVQFKLEVMDSQGNIGQMIKNVKIGEKTVIQPPLPVSKNKKPHAIAKVKTVVKAGEKVWADGRDSYDSDGRIVSYDWDSPHTVFPEADDQERVYFYPFYVTDNSELRLKVKDNDDLSDSEELKYDVVNPISPLINQTGFRKVNRKLNLNAYKSRGTKYFPIEWDKTEWKITPMEGQSMDSIKVDGDLSGASIDALFKETGKYKVWMKLYTNCTYEDEEYSYSAETENFIWIKPDEKPIANINVKKLTYRNPDTDGVAVLQVADDSNSLDGDFIENKKWWFAFDSDNDDSFEDEDFVLISDGNENVIHQNVNHVGKY
ncbi:MAG: hypothetical protein N4A76_00005, partial [Firmicutes bacterium]|nr:hypothetical protein [Bacillota bacterium]